ncbi:MAG: serine/threonine protein phosphatase, partial [Deltaproteobacteria bacterium]|nr:serine/threonine protein phosphatase [Deltaproteobacteria bacterium]
MKPKGLALKLILLILTSITIIFCFIFSYNYYFSRRIILQNVSENADNLAKATVNPIDMVLRSIEKVPQNLAYFLESFSYHGGDLIDLVR